MDTFLTVITAVLGLCWGSFLNVLIVRTLSGESIIYPPSKCPKCQHKLYWWHNIPLLSFLMLHGKCYFCNKSISIRYPIVEVMGMCIVLFSFVRYVSVFDAIAVTLILSLLLVISFTDVEVKKISLKQMLIVVVAGLIFNRYDILNSILGCFVGAGMVSALILTGRNYFNKEIFGLGDVYLMGALGSVIGFDKLFIYIMYLVFLQFIIVLPKYILSLIQENQVETLKYLIIFGITCLFLYVSKNIVFVGSNVVLLGFLGVLIFCAYKLAKNILQTLKVADNQSYYPLAPVVAICCLLFLC